MVSGSTRGIGIFLKSCPIYKFKLILSVYSTNILKFRNIGSSGLDVSVDVAPIDSEGSSVVRSRGRLGSAGWSSPSFIKILFWGGGGNSDS